MIRSLRSTTILLKEGGIVMTVKCIKIVENVQ